MGTAARCLCLGATLVLGSCTSTVSSIDTVSSSLEPQLTSPLPANGPLPDSAQLPAPAAPGQATAQGAQLAMAPTTAPNAAAVPLADPALPTPAEAQTLNAQAAKLPVPADPALAAPAATAKPAQAKAADAPPPLQAPEPVVVLTPPAPPVATAAPGEQNAAAPTGQTVVADSAPSPAKAAVAGKAVQELRNAPQQQQFLENAPANPAPKKRKTLFDTMFGGNAANQQARQPDAETQLALAEPQPKPLAKANVDAEPLTPKLVLTDTAQDSTSASAPNTENGDLPGVRKGALFEIKRRDSLNSDADIDISETDDGPIQLASAAGLARLAPNGLKVQRESVDVACLKPQLVRMLKKIEAHYGRSVMVTSGYRSPSHNRRVRGAKNSLHMFCAAADIEVDGVSRWELAKYARSMPERGGVGTYCHTEAVHVDIGPNRDWNWRCSRRK